MPQTNERRIYLAQRAEDAQAAGTGRRPQLLATEADVDAWEERQALSGSSVACAVADAFAAIPPALRAEIARAGTVGVRVLLFEIERLEAATAAAEKRKIRLGDAR